MACFKTLIDNIIDINLDANLIVKEGLFLKLAPSRLIAGYVVPPQFSRFS